MEHESIQLQATRQAFLDFLEKNDFFDLWRMAGGEIDISAAGGSFFHYVDSVLLRFFDDSGSGTWYCVASGRHPPHVLHSEDITKITVTRHLDFGRVVIRYLDARVREVDPNTIIDV